MTRALVLAVWLAAVACGGKDTAHEGSLFWRYNGTTIQLKPV
jgi:hypothetical protein